MEAVVFIFINVSEGISLRRESSFKINLRNLSLAENLSTYRPQQLRFVRLLIDYSACRLCWKNSLDIRQWISNGKNRIQYIRIMTIFHTLSVMRHSLTFTLQGKIRVLTCAGHTEWLLKALMIDGEFLCEFTSDDSMLALRVNGKNKSEVDKWTVKFEWNSYPGLRN